MRYLYYSLSDQTLSYVIIEIIQQSLLKSNILAHFDGLILTPHILQLQNNFIKDSKALIHSIIMDKRYLFNKGLLFC